MMDHSFFPSPIDFPVSQIAGTGGMAERLLRSGPRISRIAHQRSALRIDVRPFSDRWSDQGFQSAVEIGHGCWRIREMHPGTRTRNAHGNGPAYSRHRKPYLAGGTGLQLGHGLFMTTHLSHNLGGLEWFDCVTKPSCKITVCFSGLSAILVRTCEIWGRVSTGFESTRVGQSELGVDDFTYLAVAHDLVGLISPKVSLTGILALAPNVLILR